MKLCNNVILCPTRRYSTIKSDMFFITRRRWRIDNLAYQRYEYK
jgi:hypothetical protein